MRGLRRGSSRWAAPTITRRCWPTTISRPLALAKASGIEAESLVESARRALRDAGDRAAALYAVRSAERFYDAALELWPEDGVERAELLYRRALPTGYHVAGGDPDRLAEARDAMLALGRPTGPPSSRA